MPDLEGKVALVTGAGRGIGLGIARVLAERGAAVLINDLPGANGLAGEQAASLRQAGCQADVCLGDVSDESEVEAMFDRIDRWPGRLDILVNNAGTTRAHDIFETTLAEWQSVLDTNLTSAFLCSKQAVLRMRGQGGGRIVNIGSVVGHQGALKGHVHYTASKAGLLGLTKALARTAAPLGITVNCIAPGIIQTDLLEKTHGVEGVAELTRSTPLGLGTPRDVGLAVAFLCGEGGRYITGATLDVNGGLYLR